MEKIEFKQVNETVYQEQLENGLRVFLLPKKGFSKTFAIFTTNYGSIDNTFVPLGETEMTHVPDGIAHFLEHKMFEKEDGDVFFKFGEKGAFTNAFTSFTRTAYLFSGTSYIQENLETLLDFVQEPYFTEETVEKEKGIIGQEIRMYEDDADFRAYFGVIENMYKEHPVKIDIAGTVESISEIDKDLLYLCYHTFYHPSNMVLFVVGQLDPETTMADIRANQSKKTFEKPKEIKRAFPNEQEEVAIKTREVKFPIQIPKVLVGIKENIGLLRGFDAVKHEMIADIALEILFGTTSDNYLTFYNEGIIDDTFGFDYSLQDSFSFVIIGGDSVKPDEQSEAIQNAILKSAEAGISNEELELVKRKKMGQFLRSLNSPEFIANQFSQYILEDASLFDIPKATQQVTKEDIDKFIKSLAKDDKITTFKLLPEEN
ncbi:EF-P 5-aminopentanol modification-associated protein YfmH [Listeria fleischmannii]|uniref:Insulinase family protein n=1 Tax=Listeria fleischmannii TaxID=1069827 RepID=A0A841YGL7_9LIST|nr:pitrilysin family protein [Listeria fleischmannii]EIA20641.1 peptidase M16 family protein [Listeria fleischmannii subsp. coloradonensis]MBC1399197.1 insulinase family protein [Listeria fleischmannii]MBC1427651.1 insulinase family protein [Listeria fleischmannii]STY34848.1 protease3 [Listeria fleischmannii subsp. coloradonensis]